MAYCFIHVWVSLWVCVHVWSHIPLRVATCNRSLFSLLAHAMWEYTSTLRPEFSLFPMNTIRTQTVFVKMAKTKQKQSLSDSVSLANGTLCSLLHTWGIPQGVMAQRTLSQTISLLQLESCKQPRQCCLAVVVTEGTGQSLWVDSSHHTHPVCGQGRSQNPASWTSAAWHLARREEEPHLWTVTQRISALDGNTDTFRTANSSPDWPSSIDELSLHMCKSKRDMKVWYDDSLTSWRSKYWLMLLGAPGGAAGASAHRLWSPGDGGAAYNTGGAQHRNYSRNAHRRLA